MPNIAIVWDFDGTLSPQDSTTEVIEFFGQNKNGDFWQNIKTLGGGKKLPEWEHVLASDAPKWMYSLSRIAFKHKAPLNQEFFREFILPRIKLFENVIEFLRGLKNLEKTNVFCDLIPIQVNNYA